LDLTKELLESQRDFDYVDDDSLANVLKLRQESFENLSGSAYRTIIVPGAD
jgi:hypothetical protein